MTTPYGDDGGAHAADDVERLVRAGGRRETPDPVRREAARTAVSAAWRETVRGRRRWRALIATVPALATAATLVFLLWPRSADRVLSPVAVAHLAASTDVVRMRDGSTVRMLAAGDLVRAGSSVETSSGVAATFRLEGGGELRLNGDTIIDWGAPRQVSLDRGQLYVDSGGRAAPLAVRTFAGVVRDVGTRFEVRVRNGELRVRVRDGAVRLESASGEHHDAAAGRELLAIAGRPVVDHPVPAFGPDWDWIIRATPFRLEGATIEQFFTWVEVEGGRTIEVRDPRLRERLGGIVLHGSIRGLSMDEALQVALPAAGLRPILQGSRVIVERAGNGARR